MDIKEIKLISLILELKIFLYVYNVVITLGTQLWCSFLYRKKKLGGVVIK